MSDTPIAYVRTDEAPKLPPPPNTTGVVGWLRTNLFPSPINSVLTIVFGALAFYLAWRLLAFAVFNAIWTGSDRQACLGDNMGACWPLVLDKIGQWVYGFYPIDQRWRVNLCFLAFAAGAIPTLIPSVPFKRETVLYLFFVFPVVILVLLTGGNLGFGAGGYESVLAFMMFAAVGLPFIAYGIEDGITRNPLGVGLALLAFIAWIASFATGSLPVVLAGSRVDAVTFASNVLSLAAGVVSLLVAFRDSQRRGVAPIIGWAVVLAYLLVTMVILDFDFKLERVETQQWGGLLVTLVVAVTGIVASLPAGILLALGRRSRMPVVRTLSVVFIEVIRGVPLITVLFMSSVMLPLFLPPGVSFDKLLRALVGVALFSSAYMAEVVRGGLQAIPKGQYEGAMSLGLSYWQMMINIVLPQALRISIPNIVGNFISLFKDTTLVLIIGLFDLLGIVQAGLRDPKWATPVSAATGYLTVAIIYWLFCFGMSRYSMFMERRLHTGHKR